MLLEEGSDKSKATALTLFDGDAFSVGMSFGLDRPAVFRQFSAAGLPHAYEHYLELLEFEGNTLDGATFSLPVAHVIAEEIMYDLVPDDMVIDSASDIRQHRNL